MGDAVKLLIEIPKKTVAHIRSDYGHGCKSMRDDDKEIIIDAIYNTAPLDAMKTRALCTPRKDTDDSDPMIGIVWYNGLEDIVIKWKDHVAGYDEVPYYKYESSLSAADYAQLQMVWMYLVLCFGNYGTSPRSGWIEDSEGYKKWFEELEELMSPLA